MGCPPMVASGRPVVAAEDPKASISSPVAGSYRSLTSRPRRTVSVMNPQVAAEIPLLGDERHKNWAKVVYSVDTSVSSGWAYDGEFVAAGAIQDVPAGGVLLVYGERGSRSNPMIEARVYQINPEGSLSERGIGKGRGWARTLRDTVEQLLADDMPMPLADLSGYADIELVEELTPDKGCEQNAERADKTEHSDHGASNSCRRLFTEQRISGDNSTNLPDSQHECRRQHGTHIIGITDLTDDEITDYGESHRDKEPGYTIDSVEDIAENRRPNPGR